MKTITTKAWVLHKGDPNKPGPGELVEEYIEFPDIDDDELLVEPIYGSWEGNMTHGLERKPVDICRARGENKIVLGNSGVVRVLKSGKATTDLSEGDLGVLVPIGESDENGCLKLVFGFDSPGSIGMLAQKTKLKRHQIIPLRNTKFDLKQWAAFSVRYTTAWSNWRIARGCRALRVNSESPKDIFVCAWGGGVSLAQVALAQHEGCNAAMIASTDKRLQQIEQLGVLPIDRRKFIDLNLDPEKFENDPHYRSRYLSAEWEFMKAVRRFSRDRGVSIFIDNIGVPVYRATMRALGKQGVITTCGWKAGSTLSLSRAKECMNHHTHVFTHGSTYEEGVAASEYAERKGWLPPISEKIYDWHEIPLLASEFGKGQVESYFPIYQVNPL